MAFQYDIIIIGGGGAGLRAAISIGETNPELKVGMVSKVYPMRSHTVAAEGGAAGVIKDNDSFDDHCMDTIAGGDWMSDQDSVEFFVSEAPRELIMMEHWGCPWSRENNGTVAVRPFGGMKIERTWFAADKTGFHMLHTLFQTSLKYSNVIRHDEWFATKLLVENGRCQGVSAIEISTGKQHVIAAKSVIICTGGAGRVFPFTTNGSIKTGDGMSLAYRAGIPLKDMEFVQYHPTGLPGTGILITEAARGEGGILVNKEGYRYLQDYELGTPLDINDSRHPVKKSMELGPRDRLSQAFIKEREKGKTIPGQYGDVVHLDIRHLGKNKIAKKLPFVMELAKNYAGIDPGTELIPVRPVVHYMMGGIDTNRDGSTKLQGLFAAGECACVSINGANRLGSNSLTEILVYGALAGKSAAAFATEHPEIDLQALEKQGKEESQRITNNFMQKEGGSERIATIRQEMQQVMEQNVGIYRSESGLKHAEAKIQELKERFSSIIIEDKSANFNTELTSVIELENMLDIAETIVCSALSRKESRGSHQRTDFTVRDDENFLRHSLAYKTDAESRIKYQDVVITRWPPAERIYGKEE